MNVLILFATIEGQTGKVARFAEEKVRDLGHSVTLADADDPTPVSFGGFDAVILAAPVHQRRHPKNFEAVLEGYSADLNQRRTLFLSVSLNAAFAEGLEEAGEYVTEVKMRTGLNPDSEALVAGAVRTGHYDYFAQQVVRHVVLRGRAQDVEQGEHEFTDWDQLANDITAFLG